VLYGYRWPPNRLVTLVLSGYNAPPEPVQVGLHGQFTFEIGQNHGFFHGPPPVGTYALVVSGLCGRPAVTTHFSVTGS
jgi:hypothetical protein